VALGAEILDFVGLAFLHDTRQVATVYQISIAELDAVDEIAFSQQKFG